MSTLPTSPAGGPPPLGPDQPWLAPLAGFSDLPFRLLCREHGAAAACTEMVSAKGLLYRSPGTEALLRTCPEDTPLITQLYGADAGLVARATAQLLARGHTWFDLNAGCPVPKVTKTGCGAAMLKDTGTLANLTRVVRAMVALVGAGRVGVKFRLGWRPGQAVYLDLARALEQEGVGWLTLHPRWATQGYSGVADWGALAKLTAVVSVPVIASGDLLSAGLGVQCLAETGVAGLMFARGAMANPMIFNGFKRLPHDGQASEPPLATGPELLDLARRHWALCATYGEEWMALRRMRGFVPRYLRHVPGARALRKRIASCMSWNDMEAYLTDALLADPGSVTEPDTGPDVRADISSDGNNETVR